MSELEEAIKYYEKEAEKQEIKAKSYPRPDKNVKGICDEARYKPVDTPKTYICDPEKNTECKKTHCQTLCFRTTEPKYRKIDEVNKEVK